MKKRIVSSIAKRIFGIAATLFVLGGAYCVTPVYAESTTEINYYADAAKESKIDNVTIYNGIDYADVYDTNYYAQNNADVYEALGNDPDALIAHFVNFGMSEGRCAKDNFNVIEYMYGIYNEDLRQVYGADIKSYYYHYMNCGKTEGRSVSDYNSVFNPKYYLKHNPDVKEYLVGRYTSDGNTDGWALWHFCEYGMNEGRTGSYEFGVYNYLAQNPDVYTAYGADLRAATQQYLLFGKQEQRKTVPLYDLYNLSDRRPDVVKNYENDMLGRVSWYINFGVNEANAPAGNKQQGGEPTEDNNTQKKIEILPADANEVEKFRETIDGNYDDRPRNEVQVQSGYYTDLDPQLLDLGYERQYITSHLPYQSYYDFYSFNQTISCIMPVSVSYAYGVESEKRPILLNYSQPVRDFKEYAESIGFSGDVWVEYESLAKYQGVECCIIYITKSWEEIKNT